MHPMTSGNNGILRSLSGADCLYYITLGSNTIPLERLRIPNVASFLPRAMSLVITEQNLFYKL